MILVDFNQTMLSNLHAQLGHHTNSKVEEGMFRHMVLNSLRSFKQKFGAEYGQMVIACDNSNYWRKQYFPYYKANRKKNMEASEINWKEVFECMNKIRQELKDYFPYKVIDVESAEADDVIATLVAENGSFLNTGEKILILSGDKDFIQLHTYSNVKQYDPTRKRWITHNDPAKYLLEHVLKGDSGDGVPNVLSKDNCFVVGERQKPLTAKRIERLLSENVENYSDDIRRNYSRNQTLINFSFIPQHIHDKILTQYKNQGVQDRSKLVPYFMKYKLKNLMENLADF